MEPAVIVNARSGRARRDPALAERLAQLLPPSRVAVTADPADVGPALEGLRSSGSDVLAVVGGDGSIGGTLTELLRVWPAAELPAVMPTPGGTVNTIAHSLGARNDPETLVRRLLAGDPLRVDTRRPLVRVRSEGGAERAGMIFANGVAVRWLRMYYDDSPRGVLGASSVVARIGASALLGGALARRMFEVAAAEIEVDGEPHPLTRFTAMAAASVEHIGLGFRPFFTAGSSPERFHYIATDAPPGRLARALPSLRLGGAEGCAFLEHRAARRVSLRFETPQPWSLDADLFEPARELTLEATTPLRFVVP